jgi:hypothetical protein
MTPPDRGVEADGGGEADTHRFHVGDRERGGDREPTDHHRCAPVAVPVPAVPSAGFLDVGVAVGVPRGRRLKCTFGSPSRGRITNTNVGSHRALRPSGLNSSSRPPQPFWELREYQAGLV